MHRFYQANITNKHTSFEIRDDGIVHQISRVLRMKVDEKIALFNGGGVDFLCEIRSVAKDCVGVDVVNRVKSEAEREIKIHLYQGVPNVWSKFEEVVRKCTELGAISFHPVIMERSETRLKNGDLPPKLERLSKIMIEACEQCGGSVLPMIGNVEDLKSASDAAPGVKIMAYEGDKETSLEELMSEMRNAGEVSLFVGPEGGITKGEAEYFVKSGGGTFNLGKRILRTETAPVAVIGRICF
ncbi:MAG: hypothetical protein UV80_C0002G0192 [Candidatus Peregrinibacteria bacterium GW2011_GWF2_43_17]|nr:MAG: hypothetical protein UV80_C0002G0192 [Candidatus Peregrinibacteria bacterium GW2011_GWF2_43_17]KKT20203.1 MAG: Ribosomal RNA small subunit methyltransferase E [Candidatus Peregrinibacteria bacterium GW2011_GWA2_43_8]